MHIAAHNIDWIASVPSIQKLHNLLEFIKENNINIMAILETNIGYRQEYFINQDIKSKLGLYDVCRILYPDAELFIYEKWDKNKWDEKDTDREEIKRRFNELWDNVMSAISIAINIELPMKVVKYLGSRNIRHKLSFADKTMRHTTKLESLIRKICKDQDFLIAKYAYWIDYWLNRFNKYNDDYRRKEYDKFIDKHEELIIPTHDLFSDIWINNVKGVVKQRIKIDKNYLQAQRLSKIQESIEKRCNIIHSDIPKWLFSTQDAVKEHIIIDRAVISNKNESVRLAIDPDTIRTHAKDTFAGILQKRNTKSIEQDVFWSNIYRPKDLL
ncbi:uncharacterized protein OCT59_001754 [Rhizophagus irregularis]|uniref:uncharacterized protein n=1 Tax=Rhizophagus irregularis TaxID=588596 RepID=UPI0033293C90|nr:hypothetical protein OCT59_001754 [Rhizophagus irregularis]